MSDYNSNSLIIGDYFLLTLFVESDTHTKSCKSLVSLDFSFISPVISYWFRCKILSISSLILQQTIRSLPLGMPILELNSPIPWKVQNVQKERWPGKIIKLSIEVLLIQIRAPTTILPHRVQTNDNKLDKTRKRQSLSIIRRAILFTRNILTGREQEKFAWPSLFSFLFFWWGVR